MLELYQTPLDILYLILSMSIGFITLLFVLLLYKLLRILGNVQKVTTKAKDTMDLLNHYLWQPIKFLMIFMEKIKGMKK